MEFQTLGRTCSGGHIFNAHGATLEELKKTLGMMHHSIIITYGAHGQANYPDGTWGGIVKILNDLTKEKAPNLRAINLGPWSAGSTLWMLRQGPEIDNERNDAKK